MSYKDWKLIKLSDIGEIITGKTPPTKQDIYWGGSIPFLTPSDDMNQKNIVKTLRYVTEKAAKDFNKNYLPIDSICVSCIGSDLGKVVKAKKRLITNQQINSIIPKKSYDSDFIYYSLTILGKKMNYLSKTSTAVPIINKSTFSNFEISIPHIKIQKSIANILSSLDDKIELNNKINKNLEELAQTLYKQWFVDFEFPNENGEPYKSSGGKMIESELGLIPKGWRVLSLDKELEFERGVEPGAKNYHDLDNLPELVAFFRVGDLNNKKPVYVDEKYLKNKTVNETDVLVSFDGAIGRVGIGFEGSYSTGLRKIYSKENIDLKSPLIYLIFKSENIQNIINAHANGTTILHASSSIKFLKISFNEKIYKKFQEKIYPIYNKMIQIIKENESLAQTRDLLLPKLMSGEIRVPVKG